MSDIITDKRKTGFFMVDNEVLDDYSLSPYDFMVYCSFLKYAGNKNFCFPSLNTLAEKLKISKPQIIKSIKILEQKKLISIQKTQNKDKSYVTNNYIINNVDKYYDGVVNHIDKGSKPYEQGVVNSVYSNNTHINNTHKNNINIIAEKKFSENQSESDNKKEIATSNEFACDPSDIRPSDTLSFLLKSQEEKSNITNLKPNTFNKQIEAHRTTVNCQNDKNIKTYKKSLLCEDIDLIADVDPIGKPSPSIPAENKTLTTNVISKKDKPKKVIKPKKEKLIFTKDKMFWKDIVSDFVESYEKYTGQAWVKSGKEFKHIRLLVDHFDYWIKYNEPENDGLAYWWTWIDEIIEVYVKRNKNKKDYYLLPTAAILDSNIHQYLPKSFKRDKPLEWDNEKENANA
ncbi:MAG TPA: helix-turn-helix domain-containing protein [Spirochaetota bacterium]|nr:helix-turn-helix domain-containing protein [Spirochaetota bacterium]